MANTEPVPLLDVRSDDAFRHGHIAGSVNIPACELDERMYELPEKGAVLGVFHDDVKVRDCAMALLRERGYTVQPVTGLPADEHGPSWARLWSPTPLLVEALNFAPAAGEAADLACGSGREAVYLAMHGWRVDGYDVLPDALENARRLARRCGAALNGIERDLRREPGLGSERYDLVCMFRFWDEAVCAAAVRALRPGGLLAVEVFAEGDQKRATRLVAADELASHADGLNVLVSRERVRNGRRFAQLIARRG